MGWTILAPPPRSHSGLAADTNPPGSGCGLFDKSLPLGLPWLRFDSHPNTVMHRVRVYTALYPREVQILSQGYVPLTCVHLLSGNSLHIWEVRNSSLVFTEVYWGTVKEPTFVLFFYPTNSGSFNLLRFSVWCHWSIYFTLFINEKWKGTARGPSQLVSIIWLIKTQNETLQLLEGSQRLSPMAHELFVFWLFE